MAIYRLFLTLLLCAVLVPGIFAQNKMGTPKISEENKKFNREFSGTWLPDGYWVNTNREGIFEQEDRFYIVSVVDPFASSTRSIINELEIIKKENLDLEVFIVLRPDSNTTLNHADLSNFIVRNDINLPVYVALGEPARYAQLKYDSLPNSYFIRNNFSIVQAHHGSGIWDSIEENAELMLPLWKNNRVTKSGMIGTFDGTLNFGRKQGVLNYPVAIEGDNRGERIWIWTAGENQILELNENGDVVNIIGSGIKGTKNGDYLSCQLGNSGDIVFDSKNEKLYLADHYSNTIREVDLDKKKISTLLGDGSLNSNTLPNQIKTGDKFGLKSPHSIELVGDLLYFTMTDDHAIWKYDLLKKEATRVIGNGNAGFIDGKKKKALLNQPTGLAVNSEGEIVFVDGESNGIRKWNGKKLISIENSELGSGSHELMALQDSILIISEYSNTVRSFTNIRGLSKVDSTLQQASYKNARLGKAAFSYPVQSTVINGLVYIADAGNQCVRILDPESRMVQTMPIGNDEMVLDQKIIFDGVSTMIYLEEVKVVEGQNTIEVNVIMPPGFSHPEGGRSTVFVLDNELDELVDFDILEGQILLTTEAAPLNANMTFEFAMEYVEDAKPEIKLLRTCRVFIPFSMNEDQDASNYHKLSFVPLQFR